jgi:ubiquinone/menaquinone biosynthesis C-methylase UbiE
MKKPKATVIDVCCGPKMFWFDKHNPDVLFADIRRLPPTWDRDTKTRNARLFSVEPDMLADFTALPFPDGRFRVVVFDPPHLVSAGDKSYMALKYGKLDADYAAQLRAGFAECFRVLRRHGLLVFKWNATQIPVSKILILTPRAPLLGQRCGKSAKTHWLLFKK